MKHPVMPSVVGIPSSTCLLLYSFLCLAVGGIPATPPPALGAENLLVVTGNQGASDDPSFPSSWDGFAETVFSCRVNRDAPDQVYVSDDGFVFHFGSFPIRTAGLLYFDVSIIPAGRRVKRAVLHMKTWAVGINPDPARPDSLFACADTILSDTRWVGANSATHSEPREGESGPWEPALSTRATYRKYGIVSKAWTTAVPPGLDIPGVGWWSLDVTRGVQAWVSGAPNAGFWLFGRAVSNKPASIYWSQAVATGYRPWLEVVWEDAPYVGPWPGGKEVAFTFSTDDGYRADNLMWGSVMDSLGYHFTICVVDSFIRSAGHPPDPGAKLQASDLAALIANGHEIAGHSTAHRHWNPETVPDSVVWWGIDPAAITQHLPQGYQLASLAWPYHLHNRRLCEIAAASGYQVCRNGGFDWDPPYGGSFCSWDSCRLTEVAVTCFPTYMTSDEAATRQYIRDCIREGLEHGNGWVITYAHTMDPRYDGIDVTRQELIWVMDELTQSGKVWIETLGAVGAYYRQHHTPSPTDPLLWIRNERPVAAPDFASTQAPESVEIDLLFNDSDPDGTLDPGSVAVLSPPRHGQVDLNTLTGLATYTPEIAFAGPDTFTYTVRDDLGAVSDEAQVTIEVTPPPLSIIITQMDAHSEGVGIHVSWATSGGGIAGFEIWRALWRAEGGLSAYPEYDDAPGNLLPIRPPSRAAILNDPTWELAGETGPEARIFDDNPSPRGVYFYEVFGRDAYGSYSSPATNGVRATNYILGDLVTPEGVIDVADVTTFAASYGLEAADTGFNNEADIGPTDDSSGGGIPLTDDQIEFEDLMIIAMNFDGVPDAAKSAEKVSTSVRVAWAKAGERTWALLLLPGCAGCKAIRLRGVLPWGTSALVERGPLLDSQSQPCVVMQSSDHLFNAGLAVLGARATITGDGELCRVTLPPGILPDAVSISARDADNDSLAVEPVVAEGGVDQPVDWLGPGTPNPSNPRTRIEFRISSAGSVGLDLFDVRGRHVRCLVATDLTAGPHEVEWDGQAADGGAAASGAYFCRLRTARGVLTRRLLLIK